MPVKVERLCRDILRDPVRISIGDKVGSAAASVTQHCVVLESAEHKWAWLRTSLEGLLRQRGEGGRPAQCLIFLNSKQGASDIYERIRQHMPSLRPICLHGDVEQADRLKAIKALRDQAADALVATDVAARGLDIPTIRVVISYDAARSSDTHTHRIGRTGRAGALGDAFTLVPKDDSKTAHFLVESFKSAGQPVPPDLARIAGEGGGGGPRRIPQQGGNRWDKPAATSTFVQSRGDHTLHSVDNVAPKAKEDSSSDDDLLAPGATSAFGNAAAGGKRRVPQMPSAGFQFQMRPPPVPEMPKEKRRDGSSKAHGWS